VADGVQAFILIQTAVNAPDVARMIRTIPGIEAADDVSGPYDVIVRVSAADLNALGELVVSRIQAVDGITRTLTCPITRLEAD
jgi:DNA-binding Lrp family transcriptional regulator